jgi:hypothetical protein
MRREKTMKVGAVGIDGTDRSNEYGKLNRLQRRSTER